LCLTSTGRLSISATSSSNKASLSSASATVSSSIYFCKNFVIKRFFVGSLFILVYTIGCFSTMARYKYRGDFYMPYNERDKRLQCSNIIRKLHGLSGNNFQKSCADVLEVLHNCKKENFERVEPFRGDYKNDGWVKNKAIFYQMLSPDNEYKQKQIEDKFEKDLKGLLVHINKGFWGGRITEFIFIVNMRDKDLPPNPNDFFNTLTGTLCKQYKIKFKSKVIRPDDLIDDLCNHLSDKEIQKLLIDFTDEHSIDPNILSERNILLFLKQVSEAIIKHTVSITDKDKNRVDFGHLNKDKKIILNKLEEMKPEINHYLNKIYLINDVILKLAALNNMQQFEAVKNKAIITYNELTKAENYDSADVYNGCVEALVQFTNIEESNILCAKLTVAYLFQMCDLFQKE